MTSVLFDVPGPTARRRHRLYALGTVIVLLAVAAGLLGVLGARGQLDQAKWDFLQDPGTYRAIGGGLQHTAMAAVAAILLALAFGTVFAVVRLSKQAWLHWPAVVIVEFFRAVPLVLLILFIFLGYSQHLGAFWSLVIALVLYNGSVLAEIFRAGVAAVPHGQVEAAYAIGLRKGQVLRLIQMPQAVRLMLPAIISQSVVALKDTALGYIIGYLELARVGQSLYVYYNNPLQAGIVIAVIYMAINYTVAKTAATVSARRARVRSTAGVEQPSAPVMPAAGPGATW